MTCLVPGPVPRSANPGGATRRDDALRRAGLAALLGLTAFALSGCETLMVATGMRMRLDDIPLQSITASLDGASALAPGANARLSVVATATDGRTLATVGTGDGKVLLDSYVFDGSLVTVDADGNVSLPADPRPTEGRTPHVRIHAAGQATPVADLDIPIRYDIPYSATYAGRNGLDGLPGHDGMDGMDGLAGSNDPNNPSAGGNGGNGSDGGNGGDGDDGSDGPAVHVTIALAPGSADTHPLLRVRVTESRADRYFIVDPAGGSLTLAVQGGAGGSGGAGGRGGRAGSGGPGQPSGMSGFAGQAGWSGHDGRGGGAGSVGVAVDPAASRYLDRFHFSNRDGRGGTGPAPVVTVGPVPAPW